MSLKVSFLNLDGTFPVPDQFHETNGAGIVRFITPADSRGIDAINRLQGDLAFRDMLIQNTINDLIRAFNASGLVSGDAIALQDPLLPGDPANKNYVDTQNKTLSMGVALVGERLRNLKSLTTLQSGWQDVQWRGQNSKERIDLTLTNIDGSPITGMDFDQVVGISLFIRAEVSGVSVSDPLATPDYVYRSVTFGQSSGFELDDIWLKPPDIISLLIPYISSFPIYPASANYVMIQPNTISIKAVVVTTQTASIVDPSLPSLDFTQPELLAIINKSIEAVSAAANISLNLPADNTKMFHRLVWVGESGTTGSSGGVAVSGLTIRFSAMPTSTGSSSLVGISPSGDLMRVAPTENQAGVSMRPLWLDSGGTILVGEAVATAYTSDVQMEADQSHPILYRDMEYGAASSATVLNYNLSINPHLVVTRPDWASKAKIRITLAAHTENNGPTPPNHGVRVLLGSPTLPNTSTDILAQAIVSWDYGNGIRTIGVPAMAYQAHTTNDVWVDLDASGNIVITVQYQLQARGDSVVNPWGIAVIQLLQYGK